MARERSTRVSKCLAKVLRHAPQDIGLTFGEQGWAGVDELLDRSAAAGMPISREELDAAAMARDRHVVLLADNGVWLTGAVPARYLVDEG